MTVPEVWLQATTSLRRFWFWTRAMGVRSECLNMKEFFNPFTGAETGSPWEFFAFHADLSYRATTLHQAFEMSLATDCGQGLLKSQT
jgi:hypothetical protein